MAGAWADIDSSPIDCGRPPIPAAVGRCHLDSKIVPGWTGDSDRHIYAAALTSEAKPSFHTSPFARAHQIRISFCSVNKVSGHTLSSHLSALAQWGLKNKHKIA